MEIELSKFEIGLVKLELSIYKTNQANPISSFDNSISIEFSMAGIRGENKMEDKNKDGDGLQPEFRCISIIP